ncbi:hypothetical protein H9Q13_05180 [Pontibacter sp. JH31]|uniref:Uncharacterized protein n=1 Tax=Pontibacter aquaedesilientis TaxID=2766980 RepID=A0ABR7XE36_9BACT|nr:hypothetical protein [Pontibacter aquaedesilientis]MBD1396550.1 hypothetical protein [Pontibacter aquaedesilientis]
MKKVIFSIFCLGFVLFLSEAMAQNSTSSSTLNSGKDEFWGTAKAQDKGSTTDAVGVRASGLDTRWNAYENSNRSRFTKNRVKGSKRMEAILKKEKAMHKKHKRDKRRLARMSY